MVKYYLCFINWLSKIRLYSHLPFYTRGILRKCSIKYTQKPFKMDRIGNWLLRPLLFESLYREKDYSKAGDYTVFISGNNIDKEFYGYIGWLTFSIITYRFHIKYVLNFIVKKYTKNIIKLTQYSCKYSSSFIS